MKKLLVAVLAFALFAPAFAVENVQITGDIQTIGLNLDGNHVTNVKLRGATNRVLLGLGADLVEDVHAQLTFAHRNTFGDAWETGETVNDIWNKTTLAEAYVNISNVFDALEVKVGRQFYGDEKSAVMYFGPDYGYAAGNNYLSLDGVTAKYNGENLTVTAAYFAMNRLSGTLNYTDDEQKLGGLDLALKLTEELSANAYVYDVRTKANDSFGFWGVKPTFETDNLKAAVEYARNYGEHEKGWQVKADLALPLELDNWTLTPRATYLKSEKGFEAFGNYRPGLIFGTFFGGGINNLLVGATEDWDVLNIGACMKFASLEKLGFGLDFYTVRINNHFMGNSWEAKVVYNHNEYVAFNLTGALLTNAGHSWNHSMTAVQLGMNIKF